MMELNLHSVFRLIQQAVPALAERRGNVVNVSSVTGLRAFPGVLAYCVSKAALDQLTRCASLELAAQGYRVMEMEGGFATWSALALPVDKLDSARAVSA